MFIVSENSYPIIAGKNVSVAVWSPDPQYDTGGLAEGLGMGLTK